MLPEAADVASEGAATRPAVASPSGGERCANAAVPTLRMRLSQGWPGVRVGEGLEVCRRGLRGCWVGWCLHVSAHRVPGDKGRRVGWPIGKWELMA